MVKLIVAMTTDKLIGNVDKLPWSIPEELRHFYNCTKGHSLLMGSKTFLSLPKKLHNRKIFVLTTQNLNLKDDIQIVKNEQQLMELFKKYNNSNETLFIAGGKSIYEKYAQYADEWIISYIWGIFPGNVYLNIKPTNYEKMTVESKEAFDIVIYKKII